MLEEKTRELKELEHEIVSSGRHMAEEKKRDVVGQVQATAKDIERVGEQLDQDAKSALERGYAEGRNRVGSAVQESEDGAHAAVARQGTALKNAVGYQGKEVPHEWCSPVNVLANPISWMCGLSSIKLCSTPFVLPSSAGGSTTVVRFRWSLFHVVCSL